MKTVGLSMICAGLAFLLLSFLLSESTLTWGIVLGTSILLNITGTALIMRFLKAPNITADMQQSRGRNL
ncbi:hypothetical protein ES066_13835 [Bacillus subtilis]|uniref:hypothetical protein n=3 Tax=Bacillaceae TaxID=186817 RepID=UPI00102EAF91|nr:hypothetical protein [Bacillus subtilis]TAH82631.1 hypothetical protein ES060_02285 [Bacillus subtilis]TAH87768.1 hypothetical protein ES066_13835 [Bacillus subtilis]